MKYLLLESIRCAQKELSLYNNELYRQHISVLQYIIDQLLLVSHAQGRRREGYNYFYNVFVGVTHQFIRMTSKVDILLD